MTMHRSPSRAANWPYAAAIVAGLVAAVISWTRVNTPGEPVSVLSPLISGIVLGALTLFALTLLQTDRPIGILVTAFTIAGCIVVLIWGISAGQWVAITGLLAMLAILARRRKPRP